MKLQAGHSPLASHSTKREMMVAAPNKKPTCRGDSLHELGSIGHRNCLPCCRKRHMTHGCSNTHQRHPGPVKTEAPTFGALLLTLGPRRIALRHPRLVWCLICHAPLRKGLFLGASDDLYLLTPFLQQNW